MKNGLVALLLAVCGFASAAHANLATWELTGSVTSVTSGFAPPAFATLGQVVKVDYTMDLGARLLTFDATNYTFVGAVTSVVINNQTTSGGPSLDWNTNFLGDINISFSGRADGIEFVSFGDQDPALPYEPDVASALAVIASAVAVPGSGGSVSLRFDFAGGSAYITPTSFADVSAPEPGSALILLSGLPALAGVLRHRKRRSLAARMAT